MPTHPKWQGCASHHREPRKSAQRLPGMLNVGVAEMVVFGLLLAASALPLFLYIRHRQTKQFEQQLAEIKRARAEERAQAASVQCAVEQTEVGAAAEGKPSRRKKSKSGDANLPVLPSGSRCFVERRAREFEGVIEKVHYDDNPPYYTVVSYTLKK